MNQEWTLTKTNSEKTLIVLTGPTAVGKTDLSLELANEFNTPVISADSRQFYHELKIGTAAPAREQLSRVAHHFVGHLSIHDYYNASLFEINAMQVLEDVFKTRDYALVTGGSGLYLDALCRGIDQLPDADALTRKHVRDFYFNNGIDALRLWLKNIDPEYYQQVDLANPNRMMRGIEVFLLTGEKYSGLRTSGSHPRPFAIKRVILNLERGELNSRINRRVDQMVQQGLIEEAWQFFNQRHLNALNTVGYKEIFSWLSGQWSLKMAIEKIKTNTRRYAKRQLTWFRRYPDARWFEPSQFNEIVKFIREI
jgi:tRNA dimethylallyltransferase